MSNTNEEEHMTVSHEVASTSGQPKLKTKKKSSQQIKSSAEDGESSSQAGYEEKGRQNDKENLTSSSTELKPQFQFSSAFNKLTMSS